MSSRGASWQRKVIRGLFVLAVAYLLLTPLALRYANMARHRQYGPWSNGAAAPVTPSSTESWPAVGLSTDTGVEIVLDAPGDGRYEQLYRSVPAHATFLNWQVSKSTSGLFAPERTTTRQHLAATSGARSADELRRFRRAYADAIAAADPEVDPDDLEALASGDGTHVTFHLGGFLLNYGAIVVALVMAVVIVQLFVTVPALLIDAYERREGRPRPYGRCPKCGYNIAATMDYCPECNTWVDTAEPRPGPALDPSSRGPVAPGPWL